MHYFHKRTWLLFLILITTLLPAQLFALTADELQKQIDDRSETIKNLEKEITGYKQQIDETSKQAKTLDNTIKILDTSRKKIETDLSLTENKITKTALTIQELSNDIKNKETAIALNKEAVSLSFRNVNQTESDSLIELILRQESLSTLWNDVDSLGLFQHSLTEKSAELSLLEAELKKTYASTAAKKKELEKLEQELGDKKMVVESTKKEKAQLLSDTKDKEANYKKILDTKIALKNAFEKELRSFESELHLKIDPNSIPHTGSGVLSWPLDEIVVTQQFGDTDFSRQNPQAYNGNGHNGVDFKALIGTRVKSAQSGVVLGIGDTDAVCPKASYGKWVLIKHDNGLTSLSAHLSVVSVSAGQQVIDGQVIGYTGNTGYTTGPHLHFTVYASQGVEILEKQSKVCGGSYKMPIADLKAYLNPLLYL